MLVVYVFPHPLPNPGHFHFFPPFFDPPTTIPPGPIRTVPPPQGPPLIVIPLGPMCTDPSPAPSAMLSDWPRGPRERERPGREIVPKGALCLDLDLEWGERKFWRSFGVRPGMGMGVMAKGSKGEEERLDEGVVEAELELEEGEMDFGRRRLLGAMDLGADLVDGGAVGAGAGAGAGAAAGLGLLSFRREVARLGSIVGD